jgi:hypothetical protein
MHINESPQPGFAATRSWFGFLALLCGYRAPLNRDWPLSTRYHQAVFARSERPSCARMHPCVTWSAEGDEILFLVATRLAAEFEVMHLQVLHATAPLAPPPVEFQHPPMQFTVALRIESESRASAAELLHEVFRLTSERNACCCRLGRNL